jgi:hypothetical protein
MKKQRQLKINNVFSRQRLIIVTTAFLFVVSGLTAAIRAQTIRPTAVSGNSSGTGTANGLSRRTAISADGRYVVFQSDATDLVSGLTDTNNTTDVFLRDTRTNQTRCLSVTSAGNTTGQFRSTQPIITPDGTFVVFTSDADNLVASDTNNATDVFRVNVGSGEIVMVSRNRTNTNGGNSGSSLDFGSYKPYDISDDGRFVAFVSNASDLLPEPFLDNNNFLDIFVRDMNTSTTRCATFSTTFASTANGNSFDVNISADGNRVSFTSDGTNFVDGLTDTNGTRDIYVRDMQTMLARCVTRGFGANRNFAVGGDAGVMSENGSRIAFYSISALLAPNDVLNNVRDTFVYDYGLDTVFLVSVTPDGSANGNDQSSDPQFSENFTISITPNGRYVVFESKATNLVSGINDTNTVVDVFRRDLELGETKMVSVNRNQINAGNSRAVCGKKGASISSDGRFVAFLSQSGDMIAGFEGAGPPRPYLRDMNTGLTFAVSLSLAGDHLGGETFKPEISAHGKSVAFESASPGLTPNDANSTVDIFSTRVPVPQKSFSDFDGDGRTDLAVFRPSTGVWYSLPANGFVNIRSWGQASDRIVPADYDGDNKTDHAVFRAAEGKWYLQHSIGIVAEIIDFGLAGDIPAPADYDGDQKADVAVFRPSNGVWYIRQSSNGQVRFQNWGLGGDLPVVGDYDGDTKADVAVFRPSENTWYILRSGDGSFVALQFGLAGDRLVPADYDGDGRTDIAVFRPSERLWYIFQSRSGNTEFINFGLSDDKPVPGDYDGDGKADIAVFRPSSGDWYIWRSSSSTLSGANWGLASDIPIPSANLQ